MDKYKEISIPDFMHCEIEPKTGDDVDNNRQWIYSPKYLSLIEIIPIDEMLIVYPEEIPHKEFIYHSEKYQMEETFQLVIVQNNIEAANAANDIENLLNGVDPMTEVELLDAAWEYYKTYLQWEDSQIS